MTSKAVRAIKRLPVGRDLALRLWNRVERLAGPRDVTTYFGASLRCDPRDIIQATLTHFGVWEPNLSRLFEHTVRPGDVVVDMGANIGYFSLLGSKLVGASGRVVAIEAMPHLANEVQQNADLNGASNIRVVNVAASDKSGTLRMYAAPRGNVGMSTTREDRGFPIACEVKALPLTEILTEDERRRLSLLKCDIEGAEVPVMFHLLNHIEMFGPRLMVEVEASTQDNPLWPELFARFRAEGFRAYQVPNSLATLWHELLHDAPAQPWAEVTALPRSQADILFTRNPL